MALRKSKADILKKLGIDALNSMQQDSQEAILSGEDVILLSPTGTGKTLAFLLPLLERIDPELEAVQLMIIAPTRELAIQLEQVARKMGTGLKVEVVYGGQNFSKDRENLQHRPAILIGTPGRLADHLRRETFSVDKIRTLVIDEFDKSLEFGFDEEMEEIIYALRACEQKILTSATDAPGFPPFFRLKNPVIVNKLGETLEKLSIKTILSPEKDKLGTLVKSLCHLGDQRGIIFCNYKESIQRISDHLKVNNIRHGCFYGGLEQKDRERTLIKFRNGTHKLIVATDLAARGLDIPEINFIIHYHLPFREEEFTHRNGRTARMNAEGSAYVLVWKDEEPRDFTVDLKEEVLTEAPIPTAPEWNTLFISGGRKDKISKGDIAGLFIKEGGLEKDEVGLIEIKTDCAFVAVKKDKAKAVIAKLNNSRLKKRKVRIYEI